jgi:hypothetical protein
MGSRSVNRVDSQTAAEAIFFIESMSLTATSVFEANVISEHRHNSYFGGYLEVR